MTPINRVQERRLALKYGITTEKYRQMLESQNGCCAICKRNQEEEPFMMSVDHSHVNNSVRGLLCKKCNTMLGLVDDNIETLTTAIEYLRHHNLTTSPIIPIVLPYLPPPPVSDGTRKKMSENHWTKRGGTHGMLGRKHSAKSIQQMVDTRPHYNWHCISPSGEHHDTGAIGMFAKRHQLNLDAIYKFPLGSPIPAAHKNKRTGESRNNTTGWIFTRSWPDDLQLQSATSPGDALSQDPQLHL